MTTEQITTIITNVLTSGGVAVFLYMVIRGLKAQIGSLNKTIEVQQKTLEAMETRVSETEKIGAIYRQFLEDFPKQLENYRALHTKMKDDQIKLLQQALQEAIEQKDEKLKRTAEIELEKLKIQQKALADIPRLRKDLVETLSTLKQRLSIVSPPAEFDGSPALEPVPIDAVFFKAFLTTPSSLTDARGTVLLEGWKSQAGTVIQAKAPETKSKD